MTEFRKKVIFGENGRSIATFYSTNLCDVHEYVRKGWSYEIDYKGKGFWLRAPDEWLVDLTDPFKIWYYGNPVVNFAYFKFLKHYSDKKQLGEYINLIVKNNSVYYKDFEFEVADGPVLQSEFRIIGNDNRILSLKRDLFKSFIESSVYQEFLNEAKEYLGDIKELRIDHIEKSDYSPAIKEFYDRTNYYLKAIDCKTKEKSTIVKGLIEQLPEFDIMILIPNGCYKFINSLINDNNVDKVMFYEIHVNSHVNKCFTLFERDLTGKKVLIVDQIYSGKTLQIMKDIIIQKGGIPITLGMFPKSRYSLNHADYVTILDKVIKSSDIDFTKDWILKLYKQILNKGEN